MTPLSWREFSQVVADAKAEAGTDYGFTFQARIGEGLSCCTFTELMCSWGGSYFGPPKYLFGPVGERPVTVDGDPSVRTNRMVRQFVHGDGDPHGLSEFAGSIAPNAVFSWSVGASLSPFTDGAAVAHRNWPYSVLESGSEDAFGEDLGVMPIPYGVEPGQRRSTAWAAPCRRSAAGTSRSTPTPGTPRQQSRCCAG